MEELETQVRTHFTGAIWQVLYLPPRAREAEVVKEYPEGVDHSIEAHIFRQGFVAGLRRAKSS